MERTDGFQCLGHSNWTICTLLSQFCSPNFTTLHFYTGGHFLLPQRANNEKGKFSQLSIWMRLRGSVPGAFKLDRMQPVELILCQNFFELSPFVVGGPICYTRRTNQRFRDYINATYEPKGQKQNKFGKF